MKVGRKLMIGFQKVYVSKGFFFISLKGFLCCSGNIEVLLMSVAGQQAQNKQSERHGRRKPYYDVFGDERFIFYYVVASKKGKSLVKTML